MNVLRRWVTHSSPLVKITMAVAITSALVVVHKLYYSPYVRRKRLTQAEEWANSIIDQEERIKEHDQS